MLRTIRREGLIRARMIAADTATGDVSDVTKLESVLKNYILFNSGCNSRLIIILVCCNSVRNNRLLEDVVSGSFVVTVCEKDIIVPYRLLFLIAHSRLLYFVPCRLLFIIARE